MQRMDDSTPVMFRERRLARTEQGGVQERGQGEAPDAGAAAAQERTPVDSSGRR
jgi:hypothetical protein